MKHTPRTWGRWLASLTAAVLLTESGAPAQAEPPATQGGGDAHDPQNEALPAALNAGGIAAWRGRRNRDEPWNNFKQRWTQNESALLTRDEKDLLRLREIAYWNEPPLRDFFVAEIDAAKAGRAAPQAKAADLIQLLDQFEAEGRLDPWLMARAWHHTAGLPADETADRRRELFTRLQRHARLIDTMTRAAAQLGPGPLTERAWMSKAAPPAGYTAREKKAIDDIEAAAAKAYPISDAGTWERESVAPLKVTDAGGKLVLYRRARRLELGPGQPLNFNRLDLLETGDAAAILEHAWLGRIEIPPHTLASVWDLPDLLTPAAREELQATARRAADGDGPAADRLEAALPLAHRAVRAAALDQPAAPGAPRLRMLLMLFDDIPSPPTQPPAPTTKPSVPSPRRRE